jgi:hypothetical protein
MVTQFLIMPVSGADRGVGHGDADPSDAGPSDAPLAGVAGALYAVPRPGDPRLSRNR